MDRAEANMPDGISAPAGGEDVVAVDHAEESKGTAWPGDHAGKTPTGSVTV
jgi:hypothetical protein